MFAFTMDIHTVGDGIKVQPRNISIGYVDFTRGANSIKIISHLHKPEFKEPIRFLNESELKKAILNKKIMVGLIFDRNFDKNKFPLKGVSKVPNKTTPTEIKTPIKIIKI